jgi:hypothetical protein
MAIDLRRRLVRRRVVRDPHHSIEVQNLTRQFGYDHVAEMGRVERTPEDA